MIFEQYLHALSDDERLKILQYLSQFGEPNAVLKELAAMQLCAQEKQREFRINHKYFFWHKNKAFLESSGTCLIPMDTIKYCYLCYGDGGIGLILTDGTYKEFYAPGNAGLLVFNKLCTYIKGFENLKPYGLNDKITEIKIEAHLGINASYVLKNNAIYYVRGTLFRGIKEKIEVPSISNIIWCSQLLESDSEAGDSHIIEVYSLGQKDPCRLFFASNYIAYLVVLELKRRVPHLLYGYNEQYKEIFKRNPAELLAIGKNQMKQ